MLEWLYIGVDIMTYKYRINQLFGKRLKVPKEILDKVYDCTLSYDEYLKHDLINKIPITCLKTQHKKIVLKFGIEKLKTLDWELIDKLDPEFYQGLFLADENSDLNDLLYRNLPANYFIYENFTEKMQFLMRNEFIKVLVNSNYSFNRFIDDIKDDKLKMIIVKYVDLLSINITNPSRVEDLTSLIISLYDNQGNEDVTNEIVHNYVNRILEPTITNEFNIYQSDKFSEEEYQVCFKYVSKKEYFSKIIEPEFFKEFSEENNWKTFLSLNIPINCLKDKNIHRFLFECGLNNVAEFNLESEQYLTQDQANKLLDYAKTYNLSFEVRRSNKISKEEFYNILKKIINKSYPKNNGEYQKIKGPFRKSHPELFISDNAPIDLKTKFYQRELSLETLKSHPEYFDYLSDKELSYLFYSKNIIFDRTNGGSREEMAQIYDFIFRTFGNENANQFLFSYLNIIDGFLSLKFEEISRVNFYDYFSDDYNTVKKAIEKVIQEIITKTKIPYNENLPSSFKETYPGVFISDKAPSELKDLFYSRKIDVNYIKNHPEMREYLIGLEPELFFEYKKISVFDNTNDQDFLFYFGIDENSYKENIVTYIRKIMGEEDAFDFLLNYGKYVEQFNYSKLPFNGSISKSQFILKFDTFIFENILTGEVVYDDQLPQSFKLKYPSLFLNEDTPNEIKNKFYNRLFTVEDFVLNPQLLDYFKSIDISFAFNQDCVWSVGLFNDQENSNLLKVKLIYYFNKIEDENLKKVFVDYVTKNSSIISIEKAEYISFVLNKLYYSNASEMRSFSTEIANLILISDNPLRDLNKIENLFLKNNAPVVGKLYSVFQILHPNFNDFNFSEDSTVSPVLKSKSNFGKSVVIFSDLLRTSLGSNNRSLKDYLYNLNTGNELFKAITRGETTYQELSDDQKQTMNTFVLHLNTLYENTQVGKTIDNNILTGNIEEDLIQLARLFSENGEVNYDLPDRIVKMFGHFAGFDDFNSMNNYLNNKVLSADQRNRERSKLPIVIEKGDLVKGINSIKYLSNIFQNGSLSQEYLGSSAASDSTPLDTDFSMVLNPKVNIKDTIKSTSAFAYGPIWFVLKNDDRFTLTRDENGVKSDIKAKDISKLELFYTGSVGEDHYGVRTGFASSDIDYIVTEEKDSRIGMEIALNGFYIPVYDFFSAELIFTPEDYDLLREKMSGLAYYGKPKFNIADDLNLPEISEIKSHLEENEVDINQKQLIIEEVLAEALLQNGLTLKNRLDRDLSDGSVELLHTGSTARKTNASKDTDFDFLMRLDKKIFDSVGTLNKLKCYLLKVLGKENTCEITRNGQFRLKKVQLPGIEQPVDIDITFIQKLDKVTYSTDMALDEKLQAIKEQYPDQYSSVIANIILAKRLLNDSGIYKTNRSGNRYGGLGGVGVENWILQNGGSFKNAIIEFLTVAKDRNFEEFKNEYAIWDLGENHFSNNNSVENKRDNFIEHLTNDGYLVMKQALTKYLEQIEYQKQDSKHMV